MRNRLTAFLLFAVTLIAAQTEPQKRSCGTVIPGKAWDDWFNGEVEAFKKNAVAQKQTTNYTIPVIFHVIYNNEAVGTFPNISQAQINSQIAILNKDYAGIGYGVNNFTSTTFYQGLVADCNVNFCLAARDPNGLILAETGIERISYSAKGWAAPQSFTSQTSFRNYIDNTIKANTIWDTKRYLNIWITDVNTSVGLLGFATFPPGSGLVGLAGSGGTTDDGVWCWSRAIGDVGSLTTLYNKGRTATHEIGHYLGLRHIWGDASCGDDYCNDTPMQQDANTNCPTFPHSTCSNGQNGDMFMNFMDYCYDACMYMFTPDQRTRIQTALTNSPMRNMLTASAATLCGVGAVCTATLSNFSSVDTLHSYRRVTAASSQASCPQGAGKAGYVDGTNCFGDREKAEFISASKYNAMSNPYITGVIVLFFQYGNLGTSGGGTVGLNIYSGTSETVKPGSLLGSMVDNLVNISATTNTNGVSYCGNPNLIFSLPVIMPYKFTFPNPVPAPLWDGFYASVVLPTGVGDTVSILDASYADKNTAWERWSDSTWSDMRSSWNNVRNYKLAILPIVECRPLGIKKNSVLANSVDLFPNPSDGKFSLVTSFQSAQNVDLRIYNLLGELVYSDKLDQVRQNMTEINMQDKPGGIYFVELNNGEEKVVKRIVVAK